MFRWFWGLLFVTFVAWTWHKTQMICLPLVCLCLPTEFYFEADLFCLFSVRGGGVRTDLQEAPPATHSQFHPHQRGPVQVPPPWVPAHLPVYHAATQAPQAAPRCVGESFYFIFYFLFYALYYPFWEIQATLPG